MDNALITIYVDMDDTLCNYSKHYSRVKHEYPDIEYPQSIAGFFRGIAPLPHAVETFRWLFDHPRTDVSILTAPSLKNVHCYSEKAQWVVHHLGEDVLPKLIISNEKHKNIGDWLIDDCLTGRGQERFKGQHIHFGSNAFPDWLAVKKFFQQQIL